MSLNSQGNTTAPIQSRADFPEAVAKLREMKEEAVEPGCKFDSTVGPDRQIRQRQWQQFQPQNELSTVHATTHTSDPSIPSTEKLVACFVD